MNSHNVGSHFDDLSGKYDESKPKYYYERLTALYASMIPANKSILDAGCGTGEMLNSLKPSRGCGIDISAEMIKTARQKYPGLEFHAMPVEQLSGDAEYDYIIMVDVVEHVRDIGAMLEALRRIASRNTIIICSWYNPLWEPVVRFMEFAGMKMPEGFHRLIFSGKFMDKARDHGFVLVKKMNAFILPVPVLNLSDKINEIADKVPFLQGLMFTQVVIFRLS